MTYSALNALFLLPVAVVGVWALVVARRRGGLRGLAVLIATLVLFVMTAVFDNVMIAIGLVGYDHSRISGSFIGLAPVEDFAYALAAALLLPSLWVLLGRAPVMSGDLEQVQP
ncbi:MAG: lycopene cyclase [Microbacteriaceae bacterium]|nr:lycopene cyclase [Microbacteriaceae bacterium]